MPAILAASSTAVALASVAAWLVTAVLSRDEQHAEAS